MDRNNVDSVANLRGIAGEGTGFSPAQHSNASMQRIFSSDMLRQQ
jgi:hypothetical protein